MKIGRNQPCPCSSGRKYKKCCLAKDEAVELEAIEIAPRGSENVMGGVATVFRHTIDRVRA
jgi:SEC-C motif